VPRRLAHYSVRARDLDASTAFYTRTLGLHVGPRPPFGFPGAWLYCRDGEALEDQGCVHLIGAGEDGALNAYLGDRRTSDDAGTGALDHIAFFANDWPSDRARIEAAGVEYVERDAPMLKLLQVFLIDPDGVTIELNYPQSQAAERTKSSGHPVDPD
jgi:catechol 2,3-dioxygenase-like lactoylglutathione lyase family enzyme